MTFEEYCTTIIAESKSKKSDTDNNIEKIKDASAEHTEQLPGNPGASITDDRYCNYC